MLTTLPYTILEHIAFYLSVIPSTSCLSHSPTPTPPSNLPPLLLSNKVIYQTLNIRATPHLYSRIFQATFDSRAIRRRRKNDNVHVAELAHELKRRWIVIKRFWRRVVKRTGHSHQWIEESGCQHMDNGDEEVIDDNEELLRTDLWTVFTMFLENDGRNAAILVRYAHIDAFALQCLLPGGLLHHRAVDFNGGWTIESEVNALLGWIFWFTDFDRVPNESIEQRDEIIEALSPLYVGSFKYAFPHAPISFFYDPLHPTHRRAARRVQTNTAPAYTIPAAQNPSIHPLLTSPIHPPCLVPLSSSSSSFPPPLLTLARPLPIPPTILSYVSRQEHQFLRWPREPSGVPRGSRAPATREEARRTGWAGPTGEDYLWFLGVRTKRVELNLEDNMDPYEDEARSLSKRWDIDWARLLVCFDPFGESHIPRPRFQSRIRVYEPGLLDGLWDGKWLMTPPDIFHELLHSTEQGIPLPSGFRPPHIQTPMSFRLKEHHSFTCNPDYNLPYDDTGPGALRAWIPENVRFLQDGDQLNIYENTGSRSRLIGTYETFSPFISHRERRQKARATRATRSRWVKERSGGRRRTTHNTLTMSESDDSMSTDHEYMYNEDDTEDDDGDNDESLFGNGVWDIIITAETEPPFAEAWGALSFRGRVRPWDGLVVLERMPANGTGRWIFRGYLHGGVNLVGRWRETSTQFDAPGWEGAWVMGRRT
ncbi:hypothetical protein Clacol_007669 [Clathrus columnatus]|uniref:F-box domain-containing protein n=1 Tax=Clathrus columnatus TaxID=1419009 RepID=A0AAV5AKL8_9AGAM|nr:hypothetical protein Clacol_007669 [Clathrus columnatus]